VPFIFEGASEELRAEIEAAIERLAVLERKRAARVELEYDR